MEVTKLDFVGIPTQDMDRAIAFYKDVVGLRQDEHRDAEFWPARRASRCGSRSGRRWSGRPR